MMNIKIRFLSLLYVRKWISLDGMLEGSGE